MLTNTFQLDDVGSAATAIFSRVEILGKIKYPWAPFWYPAIFPSVQLACHWATSGCNLSPIALQNPLGLLCSPGSSLFLNKEAPGIIYTIYISIVQDRALSRKSLVKPESPL